MRVNCKHVAAIVVATAVPTEMRTQPIPAPPALPVWRQSLDALLPPASTNDRVGTPLAIELSLSVSGPSPSLDARLVRAGKRGGWVAGDLSWAKLNMLRHSGYPERSLGCFKSSMRPSGVELEFVWLPPLFVRNLCVRRREDDLAAAIERRAVAAVGRSAPRRAAAAAAPPTAGGADVCHGAAVPERDRRRDGRSGRRAHASGQRRRGTAGGVHRIVGSWRGVRRRRVAAGTPGQPATAASQRMALSDAPLVIPADEVPRFVTEYYPRLRHIAAVTSSDASFTPPEIAGPTLVLRADYQAEHELELTCEWAYRLGDNAFRSPIGTSDYAAWRDLEAETALASSIARRWSRWGSEPTHAHRRARLSGLKTMRFATGSTAARRASRCRAGGVRPPGGLPGGGWLPRHRGDDRRGRW